MADIEENAAIVNALQRHATVVVQKSLQEGFGLTVAEAMWKSRPVVASAVGGIKDQIDDGETGVLLEDPRDLQRFGAVVRELLDDPARREQLGRNAREHVRRTSSPTATRASTWSCWPQYSASTAAVIDWRPCGEGRGLIRRSGRGRSARRRRARAEKRFMSSGP